MCFKRIFSVFILFLLPILLLAQETKQTEYPFNQLRISVTPSLCSRLNVTNEGGATIFQSSPALGAEATISYYQRIVKEFGVSLGVGINSTAHSYNFSFVPVVPFPTIPEYKHEIKEKRYEPVGMITVPLALSMIIPIKSSSWNIDIQAGAKFNYLFDAGAEKLIYDYWWKDAGNPFPPTDAAAKEKSFYWVEEQKDKQVLFSYFLKAGATYTTKRNNGYFVNIVANYSPQIASEGSYLLRAIGGDSYGSFKKNINYLGLEVGYALTLCKNR